MSPCSEWCRVRGPIAYTDGACLGNPGPGGWGARLLYPDGTVRELGGAAAETTNNRMELQGALAALHVIGIGPHATVYTDSRYVIDGMTRWLHTWRKRQWMTATNTPVKNQDLWVQLAALNHSGIAWKHVRGHSGDPNNERVDAIARAFATGAVPLLFCGPAGAPDDPVADASQALPLALSCPAPGSETCQSDTPQRVVQYVSMVHGTLTLDTDWEACAARVQGISGACYARVHTLQELRAFCARQGIALPPDV